MSLSLKGLVPMAHVQDVDRSTEFYCRIGFEVAGSFTPPGETRPTWASLELHDARLMVSLASEPVIAGQQAVLFYLYFDHIDEVHAELTAAGLSPGPMAYPFYCPKGEFRMTDPDGYCLMLTHT